MSETNLKRAALKVKNIQPPVPDPLKLAPTAQSKTTVTTVLAKRKDVSASGSNGIAESTNNQSKRPKGAKTLSLSRKSKKVLPDGKKQLSMDKFIVKSPRTSLSPNHETGSVDLANKKLSMDNFIVKSPRTSLSPNHKTDSVDLTNKKINVKATPDEAMQIDEAASAKHTQATEKCDLKAKKHVGADKKKEKQGDAKIFKKRKKPAKLDPIPVDLNIAELPVNNVEGPVERADIVPQHEYPVTPVKGRIDDYGELTKLLRTPVKVSTPMPGYAIKEEEGLANFPDPVDDAEFEMDCNILKNAFEEGVVDKVDVDIAERMFYRYKPFLIAIQDNSIFSMRQEEYCQNFRRGLNMDFAPGCIILSDEHLQKLMKLMGKDFTTDDEDNLNKVQYFMLVLIPELITKIVMGVYKVNKREAITIKKEIAIKVTELMGDAIFRC